MESNQVNDNIAVTVTNNEPSIIIFGASEMPPNRPFGLKRRKRCPGSRKFLVSVKKLGHSVVKMEDEWVTSQTCANCQERFPANTKPHRFKVCYGCKAKPIARLPDSFASLPDIIVATVSKRALQKGRKEIKRRIRNGNYQDVEKILRNGRLMSKVKVTYKNWPLNVQGDVASPQTAVWHRDIVAAKCIMLKGLCRMFGVPVPDSLRRPPNNVN
ncbi:uncharacterized protein LOC116344859 [Contarinia nasturtii]|uniref:uncharacterized protein LOC116344859 n=1 Tax=Contarinia nasturtii TaxID=265458 RepID=UPI0012D454B6|nr:uncharacterized protein LOC116344859 [Contarinia nasturtii]XP_031629530.1 uncharacterized protein LOC116344859 [Contarinia nasturtii]